MFNWILNKLNQKLYIDNNRLFISYLDKTSLPYFDNETFDNLTEIECSYNNLRNSFGTEPLVSSLFTLPPLLLVFTCDSNKFLELPSLPPSLKRLSCSYNLLTAIPSLPLLTSLFCNGNIISELPSLPDSLLELQCSNNKLTSIPPLPPHLYSMTCNNNYLVALPLIPLTITYCSIGGNYFLFSRNVMIKRFVVYENYHWNNYKILNILQIKKQLVIKKKFNYFHRDVNRLCLMY